MGLFRTVGGALIGIALAPATGGASLLAAAATGAAVANVGGAINDDEKKAKAREAGFRDGLEAAKIETAKKFAIQLLQSDNMRIGAFALGLHVAKIDGANIPDEELDVIVDALGKPNSKINNPNVKSKMNEVLRESPDFAKIKLDYLNGLTSDQLQSLDGFVRDVIWADGVLAPEEKRFYNSEWAPYLSSRTKMNIPNI